MCKGCGGIEHDIAVGTDPKTVYRVPIVLKRIRQEEGSYNIVVSQSGDVYSIRIGCYIDPIIGRSIRVVAVPPDVTIGIRSAGSLSVQHIAANYAHE
jgi:hypothetical protein